MRDAERDYHALAADPALASHFSRELELSLHRRLREESEARRGQGRVIRAVVDAFVAATEAVMREEQLIRELRAFDVEDHAGARERAALLRASVAADA